MSIIKQFLLCSYYQNRRIDRSREKQNNEVYISSFKSLGTNAMLTLKLKELIDISPYLLSLQQESSYNEESKLLISNSKIISDFKNNK